jgi:hypothetical protein
MGPSTSSGTVDSSGTAGSGAESGTVAARSASIASCTTCSVSGRGTKTPGPTARSSERNGARPVMCCRGSRAARRSSSSTMRSASDGAIAASVTAFDCTSPRLSPSTWPMSSSASTRGSGTPASVSSETALVRAVCTVTSSGDVMCRSSPREDQSSLPISASCASSSDAMHDWMTGSRAPFITASRL